MKEIILLLILLPALSIGQPYFTMLEEDHIWKTRIVGCPDPCTIIYKEYQIAGEVIFNSVTYQRMASNNSNCYYREENGQVFVYNELFNQEYVAFDFTLEIDDIYVFPEPFCGQPEDRLIEEMIVVDVTTEMIAGEMRKVIYFEDTMGASEAIDIWIEGIGSISGVFPGGYNSQDSYMQLTCFTKNGVTYYFNGFTICEEIIGIEEQYGNNFSATPNPATEFITFNYPEAAGATRLRIYGLDGKQLFDISLEGNMYRMDTSGFTTGVYFYQIWNETAMLQSARFLVK